MRSPVLPYGYAWLEGKLMVDPREYKVVLKIINLWQTGKSLTAIARLLNDQKVATRMRGKWFHCTIAAIVKRENKEQNNNGGPHGAQQTN